MPGVRSAAIGVWVGVGSRDEAPTLSGASHFLEHLLFKGTPSRSALDISVSLDEVGGEFNAFTAKEYTCFHARVLDLRTSRSRSMSWVTWSPPRRWRLRTSRRSAR